MITIVIIILNAIISFLAFNNKSLLDKLIFYPPAISNKREWYRFVTCGFIHADIGHLFFNMFALFIFGKEIEEVYKSVFGNGLGGLLFILLYVIALIVCLIPTYLQNKENYYYRSLGASGAVSAVVFAYMLINPMSYLGIIFVPVYIPAFLFGIIYIIISYYLDKSKAGNINHSAHLFGGLFGLFFTYLVFHSFADVNLFSNFIDSLKHINLRNLIKTGF